MVEAHAVVVVRVAVAAVLEAARAPARVHSHLPPPQLHEARRLAPLGHPHLDRVAAELGVELRREQRRRSLFVLRRPPSDPVKNLLALHAVFVEHDEAVPFEKVPVLLLRPRHLFEILDAPHRDFAHLNLLLSLPRVPGGGGHHARGFGCDAPAVERARRGAGAERDGLGKVGRESSVGGPRVEELLEEGGLQPGLDALHRGRAVEKGGGGGERLAARLRGNLRSEPHVRIPRARHNVHLSGLEHRLLERALGHLLKLRRRG
mmetsp:Transcript_14061/g.46197  ORF Transcript_14061/g.46197 Transcript_14061/m.46197 type:complete len:262 (+) Transcript_14061:1687-2472(+)